MPRIKELAKDEVLNLIKIFVETDQEALWDIVARYMRDPTSVTPEEVKRVRDFAKYIDNIFARIIPSLHPRLKERDLKKYGAQANLIPEQNLIEIEPYLKSQISIDDRTNVGYRNATFLYYYLFNERDKAEINWGEDYLTFQVFFFIRSKDGNLAANGCLMAMHDNAGISESDSNTAFVHVHTAAWFGFDLEVSHLGLIMKQNGDEVANKLWRHRALKMTESLRILSIAEKGIFSEGWESDPNSLPHVCIIKFFGHQCDPDIEKARELLQKFDCASRILSIILNDLDPDLPEHYRIVDNPLALFQFVFENKPDIPLKENQEKISNILSLLKSTEGAELELTLNELQEYIDKRGPYYAKRFAILQGRILMTLHVFKGEIYSSEANLKNLFKQLEELSQQITESQSPDEMWRAIDKINPKDWTIPEAAQALKTYCLSLDRLHPEQVNATIPTIRLQSTHTAGETNYDVTQGYEPRAIILPTPVTYTPSVEEGPIAWATVVLNSDHSAIRAINQRLSKLFSRVPDEDKERAIHFNRSLGFLLHAIKEQVLTEEETAAIMRQIEAYKTSGDPYRNVCFLEAAFILLPKNTTRPRRNTDLAKTLQDHPSCDTFCLVDFCYHEEDILTGIMMYKGLVIDDEFYFSGTERLHALLDERMKVWRDPVAIVFMASNYSLSNSGWHLKAERRHLCMNGLVEILLDDACAITPLRALLCSLQEPFISGRFIPDRHFLTKDLFLKCWRLANKGSKDALIILFGLIQHPDMKAILDPALKTLFYCAYPIGELELDSAIKNRIAESCLEESLALRQFQKMTDADQEALAHLVLGDLPRSRSHRFILDWGKQEQLLNYISAHATFKKYISGIHLQGYLAFWHDHIPRAITILSPLPLLTFKPLTIFNFAEKIYHTVSRDRESLLWALRMLDIIWFPHIFIQNTSSFHKEVAENLHSQIEMEVDKDALESKASVSQRIRRRNLELNHLVSGAQLSMIDLFPVHLLESDDLPPLVAMRSAAAAGNLFLTETVYPFSSEAGKGLLNNLLLLSGEKKSVSREPTIDHFIVSETAATHDSGRANGGSEIVVTSGGGGGGGSGEARPEPEEDHKVILGTGRWSVFKPGGFFNKETPEEETLRKAKEAEEKRVQEAIKRMGSLITGDAVSGVKTFSLN